MKLSKSPLRISAMAALLTAMAAPSAIAQRGDHQPRADRDFGNRGNHGGRSRGEAPRGHRGDGGNRVRGDGNRGHPRFGPQGNRHQGNRGGHHTAPRANHVNAGNRHQGHRPSGHNQHRPRAHNQHRPRINHNNRFNRYGHYRPRTYSYYHHSPRYYRPRNYRPRYYTPSHAYHPRYRVGGHYIFGGHSRIIYDYHLYGLYDPPYGYHWVHDHDRGDAILASVATGAIIGLVIGALAY